MWTGHRGVLVEGHHSIGVDNRSGMKELVRRNGREGVTELIDVRGVELATLDVIVCGSDMLAEGAIAELRARGVDCSRDVAVTGFDDLDTARYFIPALSTVHQPTMELGALGARSVGCTERWPDPRWRDRATDPVSPCDDGRARFLWVRGGRLGDGAARAAIHGGQRRARDFGTAGRVGVSTIARCEGEALG